MPIAQSRDAAKLKTEALAGSPKSRSEPAARAQTNPFWHRLATHIQPKLTIGAIDDPLEREAEQVADQVMRMPDPAALETPPNVPPTIAATGRPQLRRACAKCEEEEEEYKKLQAKPIGTPGRALAGGEAPPIVHDVLRSPGQPLDPATRAFFEPRFGSDFGQVRVHSDARAAISAASIGARAYTFGSDMVFGPGQYLPILPSGRRLIAHELTHVLQQDRSANGLQPIRRTSEDVSRLDQEFQDALGKNWQKAAEVLNAFSREDITDRLGKLKRWQKALLYQGARDNPKVGPQSQVAEMTRSDWLDLNFSNELALAASAAPEAAHHWEQAAEFLNAFSRDDIVKHISKLDREQLASLHAGALDNPRVGPDSQVAQMTSPGTAQASTQGRDALGTSVIADVARQQQQGLDFEAARRDAFGKLKILLRADPSAATVEDRKAAVGVIAAAMAGLKVVAQPSMLGEGKEAHYMIGEFYKQFNRFTLLDPTLIAVIRALKLTAAAYDALYRRLPEELLESLKVRPDILDYGKMEVYEIKSFDSRVRALPEMLDYIELLESFNIPGIPASNFVFHPGSPANPGTRGILPAARIGRGWIVFCCPAPGAIIYRTLNNPENPRAALERLENEIAGISDLSVGVESWTAVVSLTLALSFSQLLGLLSDAAALAGQKIPDIVRLAPQRVLPR